MSSGINQDTIQQIIYKCDDLDSDIRFMVFSDLATLLEEQGKLIRSHGSWLSALKAPLMAHLDDRNSDTQNQVIKCFGPYIRLCDFNSALGILETLVTKACQVTVTSTFTTSPTTTAVRAVLLNISASRSNSRTLIERILQLLLNSEMSRSLDAVEILSQLLERYGAFFTQSELCKVSELLLNVAYRGESIVRKRAVSCVSLVAKHADNHVLAETFRGINAEQPGREAAATRLILLAAICKNDPTRFRPFVNESMDTIISALHLDALQQDDIELVTRDDDLREVALAALDAVAHTGPEAIKPYLPQILSICKTFLTYNPNVVLADADGDADDSDGDSDVDSEYFDDELEADEDEFDDYADISWKIRRFSLRIVVSLVETAETPARAGVLSALLPSLVARLAEDVETVRIEVIGTLATIVALAAERKDSSETRGSRRRGSDVSMAAAAGPIDILAEHVPAIVARLTRDLQSSGVSAAVAEAYMGLAISLVENLDDPVAEGGVLTDLVTVVHSSAARAASASVRSAPGISLQTLKFYTVLVQRHGFSVVPASAIGFIFEDMAAMRDANHTMLLAALSAAQGIVDRLRDYAAEVPLAENVAKPFAEVLRVAEQKAVAIDSDGETREHCIDLVAAMVAVPLPLPAELRQSALDSLVATLQTESTVLRSVDAVATVAQHAQLQPADAPWLNRVAELAAAMLYRADAETKLQVLQALLAVSAHVDLLDGGAAGRCVTCVLDTLPQIGSRAAGGSAELDLVKAAAEAKPLVFGLRYVRNFLQAGVAQQEVFQFVAQRLSVLAQLDGVVPGLRSCVVQIVRRVAEQSGDAEALYEAVAQHCGADVASPLAVHVIAGLIVGGKLNSVVQKHKAALLTADPSAVGFSLQILGQVAKEMPDLDLQPPELYKVVFDEAAPPEVRRAAAETLGDLVASRLPAVLSEVEAEFAKHGGAQPYFVAAVGEMVNVVGEAPGRVPDVADVAQQLWDVLLRVLQAEDGQTRSETDQNGKQEIQVSASGLDSTGLYEQLGKLLFVFPGLVAQCSELVAQRGFVTRKCVVGALKYTLGYTGWDSSEAEDEFAGGVGGVGGVNDTNGVEDVTANRMALQEALEAHIFDILIALLSRETSGVEELIDKQLTLSVIVSTLQNNAGMILWSPRLVPELLPLVFKELVVNPRFVRVIKMGPFSHRIDDGLETRKAAYECLYTLCTAIAVNPAPNESAQKALYSCLPDIFRHALANGLKDDQEIVILSCVILSRVAQLDIRVLAEPFNSEPPVKRMAEVVVEQFSKLINKKLQAETIKQEVDKQQEIERNVTKCVYQITKAFRGSSGGIGTEVQPEEMVERTQLDMALVGEWHRLYADVASRFQSYIADLEQQERS